MGAFACGAVDQFLVVAYVRVRIVRARVRAIAAILGADRQVTHVAIEFRWDTGASGREMESVRVNVVRTKV